MDCCSSFYQQSINCSILLWKVLTWMRYFTFHKPNYSAATTLCITIISLLRLLDCEYSNVSFICRLHRSFIYSLGIWHPMHCSTSSPLWEAYRSTMHAPQRCSDWQISSLPSAYLDYSCPFSIQSVHLPLYPTVQEQWCCSSFPPHSSSILCTIPIQVLSFWSCSHSTSPWREDTLVVQWQVHVLYWFSFNHY